MVRPRTYTSTAGYSTGKCAVVARPGGLAGEVGVLRKAGRPVLGWQVGRSGYRHNEVEFDATTLKASNAHNNEVWLILYEEPPRSARAQGHGPYIISVCMLQWPYVRAYMQKCGLV